MAIAEPPATLGELRQHVLLPLLGNSLFSEAEQLRANHFVHECEDIARLTRWGKSVQTEIACRAAAAWAEAARVRRQHALRYTLQQLRSASFRGHCPRHSAPAWSASFPSPAGNDRRAGTLDRLAAARFQPADSLTFAHLRSYQAR